MKAVIFNNDSDLEGLNLENVKLICYNNYSNHKVNFYIIDSFFALNKLSQNTTAPSKIYVHSSIFQNQSFDYIDKIKRFMIQKSAVFVPTKYNIDNRNYVDELIQEIFPEYEIINRMRNRNVSFSNEIITVKENKNQTPLKYSPPQKVIKPINKFSNVLSSNESQQESNKEVKRFLILGNSPEINQVNWEKIREICKERNIIIAGVNRIWRKFFPDIYFFIDCDIAKELIDSHIKRNSDSRWISCNYLKENCGANIISYIQENKIEIFNTPINVVKNKNSILWLIALLKEKLYPQYNCKFYTYGITLTVKENHHFWEGMEGIQFSTNKENIEKFLNSNLTGFTDLKNKKYNIVSLDFESKLHYIFPSLRNGSLEERLSCL